MPAPTYGRSRKCIGPDEEVGLKITAAERKLILGDLMGLDSDRADAIRRISASQPLEFTLDDWDYLCSKIAYRARHTKDKKVGKKLWSIYMRIWRITDSSRKGRSFLRAKPHRRAKEPRKLPGVGI
jgi:hypothetical protein